MKHYLTIAILALGIMCSTSCDKFLDVHPQGSYSVDHFFENDEQIISAVNGIYYRLAQESFMGRELYWEQGCCTDFVWGRTRNFNTLATLTYTGDESVLRDVFSGAYQEGMNRCNWIIQGLLDKQEESELSAVEYRSLGEAYFMRAFYHYIIAYRYGTKDLGVPFVAYESIEGGYNYEIPEQSESVMKDYELVIADLEKAEEILPRFEDYDAANRGRACKQSAVAVMAKVYAYWGMWDSSKWPNVISCVNKLEQTYGRDLHSSYSELFAADFSKFWTKEYCWSYPSTGGENGAGAGSIEFGGISLENNGWGKYNGWGQFKPTYDLYEEMAKDNVEEGVKNERLAKTILEYGDSFVYFGEPMRFYSQSDLEAGFQVNKYLDAFAPADPIAAGTATNNDDWPCTRVNWPIIRFADCLLLRAEAYLMADDGASAAKDINRIRERSHLKPLAGNATWTDLYHERRCELAFELAADHAFDCKRWAYAGNAEIKALALKELNSQPRVRHYVDRADPDSAYEIGEYEDYRTPTKVWTDKCLTFPYPSEQIAKSAGKLQNPPSWR
mgnify:FL=1